MQYIYPSIYLPPYLSIYPFIYYLHLFSYLSIYLTFYLSIHLSISLSIYLSLDLSVYLSPNLSIFYPPTFPLPINTLSRSKPASLRETSASHLTLLHHRYTCFPRSRVTTASSLHYPLLSPLTKLQRRANFRGGSCNTLH